MKKSYVVIVAAMTAAMFGSSLSVGIPLIRKL
jgi:uncharacterized membrane protein